MGLCTYMRFLVRCPPYAHIRANSLMGLQILEILREVGSVQTSFCRSSEAPIPLGPEPPDNPNASPNFPLSFNRIHPGSLCLDEHRRRYRSFGTDVDGRPCRVTARSFSHAALSPLVSGGWFFSRAGTFLESYSAPAAQSYRQFFIRGLREVWAGGPSRAAPLPFHFSL